MKIKLIHEVERPDVVCPSCWTNVTSGQQEEYVDDEKDEWFTCTKCGKGYPRGVGKVSKANKDK